MASSFIFSLILRPVPWSVPQTPLFLLCISHSRVLFQQETWLCLTCRLEKGFLQHRGSTNKRYDKIFLILALLYVGAGVSSAFSVSVSFFSYLLFAANLFLFIIWLDSRYKIRLKNSFHVHKCKSFRNYSGRKNSFTIVKRKKCLGVNKKCTKLIWKFVLLSSTNKHPCSQTRHLSVILLKVIYTLVIPTTIPSSFLSGSNDINIYMDKETHKNSQ